MANLGGADTTADFGDVSLSGDSITDVDGLDFGVATADIRTRGTGSDQIRIVDRAAGTSLLDLPESGPISANVQLNAAAGLDVSGSVTGIGHGDLANVATDDHHAKTTSGEIDHDSTSGGTRTDAHHARYADSEAVSAVETAGTVWTDGNLNPDYSTPDSNDDVYETGAGGAAQVRVAMASFTVSYGTIEPDTTVYRNDEAMNTLAEPGTGSFSVSAGDYVQADKPVAFVDETDAFALPSLSWAGTEFVFNVNRYSPCTVYMYAPTTPATVEHYDNANPDTDAATSTHTVPQGEVTTMEVSTENVPLRFVSDAPIVMVKRASLGSGDDAFQVPPASRELVAPQSDSVYTMRGGSWSSNGSYYWSSDDRISATATADGSGTNAEMGTPIRLLGDTYVAPHDVADYQLAAVDPTTVTVYEYDATNSVWTSINSHDLTNASRSSPGYHSEGDSSGGGTVIASGPVLFVGTAPFHMRTNTGSREYTALGFRQSEIDHYAVETLPQGSGSGLDADTLDGNDSSAFADSGHSHAHTELTSISSDDHHAKTTSASDLTDVSADSVSDAHHAKTTSASDLTDVSADSVTDAHHSRYSDEEAQDAVGAIVDSTLAYDDANNVLGVASSGISETELSFDTATQSELDTHAGTSDAHHAKYTDSEAVSAVNNEAELTVSITGDSDTVDSYDVAKDGSDTAGNINFKTSGTSTIGVHGNDYHSPNFVEGNYEVQKNGTDGSGVINFKT